MNNHPTRPIDSAKTGGASIVTRMVLYGVLAVTLCQNPFLVYRLHSDLYRIAYAVCMVVFVPAFLHDFLYGESRGRLSKYLRTYVWFTVGIYFAILLNFGMLTAMDTPYDHRAVFTATTNFVMRIVQFYVIYSIVKKLGVLRVLNKIYWLAIGLAVLGNVQSFMNLAAMEYPWQFPVTLTGETEPMYYSFPLGFHTWLTPFPVEVYRLYSYFTEPANCAIFLLLVMPYAMYKYVAHRRKWRHLIALLVILAALVWTFSTAALFASAIFVIYYGGAKTLNRRRAILALLLFSGLVLGAFAIRRWLEVAMLDTDSQIIFRRILSVEGRLLEWNYSIIELLRHPMGLGVGSRILNENALSFELVSLQKDYAGPTNLLQHVYYLGFIVLLPMGIFYGRLFGWCHSAMTSARTLDAALASMVILGFIFSLSLDQLFTAPYQIAIAAFLVAMERGLVGTDSQAMRPHRVDTSLAASAGPRSA
jgi:hypothetical protein